MAKVYTQEFNSIQDFYKYICDTPINEAFRWAKHSSTEGNYSFTQTSNFKEATDLLKNGWTDMSQKLTQKLKVAYNPAPIKKPRNVLSVSGYQPIVPLYLVGVPTNMVSKQIVNVKSKVVTLTKSINYHCGISTERIVEESVKTMQIIKQLEAQGYRCNLNIALGTCKDGRQIYSKIKIKSAGEKLNVSKLAFPLVHPSMLRRLFFRYIEVNPDVTKGYVGTYGTPASFSDMKGVFPNDVVLPAIYSTSDVSNVKSINDIEATF